MHDSMPGLQRGGQVYVGSGEERVLGRIGEADQWGSLQRSQHNMEKHSALPVNH